LKNKASQTEEGAEGQTLILSFWRQRALEDRVRAWRACPWDVLVRVGREEKDR